MVCVAGEKLSLLVLRTSPGLGNVTVDWAVEGPFVPRTFSRSSGTLFFTKVNAERKMLRWDVATPTNRLIPCDSQGQLNHTIELQLLDDATPEDKDEYKVSLGDIKTLGNFGL